MDMTLQTTTALRETGCSMWRTVIVCIFLMIAAQAAFAQTVQKADETWRISGRTYEIIINSRDGSLMSITQAGHTRSILRSSEDGLWRAKWKDGQELNARALAVEISQVNTNRLRLHFGHPKLDVIVFVTAHEDAVDFDSQLTPKQQELLEYVLPARLRFEPSQTERLIFPMGGNTSVGTAFLKRFFEPQPVERPAGWDRQSVGAKGFVQLFGGPLEIRPMDEPAVPLRATELGRKWLNPEALKLVSQRQVTVNRPPKLTPDLRVLVEAEDGRPFFVGRELEKGTLWLMAGQIGRSEHAPLQLSLIASVLDQLQLKGKPLGLINLPNEPAQGGWSAASVAQWQEMLATFGTVIDLKSGKELQDALNRRAVAAVINPYAERLPVDRKENSEKMIDEIGSYIRHGGHWFEVGGYPFHYALVPSLYYRRVSWNYPPAFADFLHLDTQVGSISVYRVQPRDWEPWVGREKNEAIFVPAALACGADEEGGYFERQFGTFVEPGKTWKAPTVRLQIGATPETALRSYSALNGMRRRLGEKMPPELLTRFKEAVLVRLTSSGQRQVEQQMNALPHVPVPSIVHFTEYLPLGFDRPYPVHLPPAEWFGSSEELSQFMTQARKMGHLVMPYTNPTWFPDQSPVWEREANAKETLALDLKGQPYRESYGSGKATGYGICLWHPLVQRYNRETVRLFTQEYPVDILFQDQCAARGWRYDTNPHSPSPYAYTEGILSMVGEDSQQVPLSTEGGWDWVAEFQVQMCGMSFGIVPTQPRPPWDRLLREAYPPSLWRVYPVAEVLVHDKVAMLMHDLGASINDQEDLAWILGLGFGLQYRVAATTLVNDEGSREWLKWLSVIQKTVCAKYIGEPLVAFEHQRDDLTAGDNDGGVMRAEYGSVKIVANLNAQPFIEGDTILAPYGFWAVAPNVVAAHVTALGKTQLDKEGLSFVIESAGNSLQIWVYGLAGQEAGVAWRGENKSPKKLVWEGGNESSAEIREGVLRFRLPEAPAGKTKRVWHAVVKDSQTP